MIYLKNNFIPDYFCYHNYNFGGSVLTFEKNIIIYIRKNFLCLKSTRIGITYLEYYKSNLRIYIGTE